MSKEAFEEFLKKVKEDAALQKELRAKFGDPAAGVPAGELAKFAASKGYTFKVEELSGRLSDDQLGAVSGGAYDAFGKVFPKVEGASAYQKVVTPSLLGFKW
jgi:predicted ribosomally synthesized peptide with nif11-like leader